MVRVICFIRPHQLEAVKSAIAATGVSGLNVSDAKGKGNSAEKERRFLADMDVLRMRSRVEVICKENQLDEVVEAIVESARTGEVGDGKIFIERILDAVRIRTEEKGELAI